MKAQLEALADKAPVARLSSAELWRHGRRKRTRSRLTAALAALLAVAVVGVPTALPAPPAAPPGMILPARVEPPPFWHRNFQQSPNGPVLLSFRVGSNPLNNLAGTTDAYVGRDGSYRLAHNTGPRVISPDGRYLATWGEVIDLSTGSRREIGRTDDVPLAWSPDSSTLLVSANYDEGLPIFLNLITVATGEHRRLIDGIGSYDGAISPDGKLAAIVFPVSATVPRLHVIDLDTGKDLFHEDLQPQQRLAGSAAFTPDSKSIALFSQNRLSYKASTGSGTVPPGRPAPEGQLIGWHGDIPVMTVDSLDAPNEQSLVRLRSDGSTETLMTAATSELILPRDVVEQAQFGGPTLSPGFEPSFWASTWAIGITALTIVVLLVGVAIFQTAGPPLARRLRRRRQPR